MDNYNKNIDILNLCFKSSEFHHEYIQANTLNNIWPV